MSRRAPEGGGGTRVEGMAPGQDAVGVCATEGGSATGGAVHLAATAARSSMMSARARLAGSALDAGSRPAGRARAAESIDEVGTVHPP